MTNNYYEKHKEKLRKEASGRYQNLSEEKKTKGLKKLDKGIKMQLKKKKKKRNKNLYEEKKKKLVEYRKITM